MLSIQGANSEPFYFIIPKKDDGLAKPQLQISIPKAAAEAFNLRNNIDVTLTKVHAFCDDSAQC